MLRALRARAGLDGRSGGHHDASGPTDGMVQLAGGEFLMGNAGPH